MPFAVQRREIQPAPALAVIGKELHRRPEKLPVRHKTKPDPVRFKTFIGLLTSNPVAKDGQYNPPRHPP